MSKYSFHLWLDDLQFESHRLSLMPNDVDVAYLSSLIHKLKSRPISTVAHGDLEIALQRLEALEQHHESLSQIMAYHIQLARIHKELTNLFSTYRVQLSEDDAFRSLIDDAVCLLDKIAHTFERSKTEQREKQWRLFNSFKYHWPLAFFVRRRHTVSLFNTYAWKRVSWGTLQLKFVLPVKAGRWAGTYLQRLR